MITSLNEWKKFNESSNREEQNALSTYQKGLIIAWGQLLYLEAHNLPETVDKIAYDDVASKDYVEETFSDLYSAYVNDDEDAMEDINEWITSGATINKGTPVLSRSWIFGELDKMTVPLTEDTIVYRTTDKILPGYSSYTLNDSPYYDNLTHYKFILPKGFRVVKTYGMADKDELIINLSDDDINKYIVK